MERVRIETSVTNTKNASLVLALNENDIILSYYKSERHGMVEQLLEMRYYRLAKKPRAEYLKKQVSIIPWSNIFSKKRLENKLDRIKLKKSKTLGRLEV